MNWFMEWLVGEQYRKVLEILYQLKAQGAQQMATTAELVQVANAAAQGITDMANAINALEAAVTAALAKIPSIPAEAQADIDAAVATLQKAATDATTAVADAADGVDEATLVVPPAP